MIWFGQSVIFLSLISQQQIQHLFKFTTESFNERKRPSRTMWFQVFWAEEHKSPKQTSRTRQTVQPNLKTRQGETVWLVSFRQAVGDDIEPTMWTDALRRSSSPHGRTLIHKMSPTAINLFISVGSSFVFWKDALWYWMDWNFFGSHWTSGFVKLLKNKSQSVRPSWIQRSGLIQNPEHIFDFLTGMFTVLIDECN